jgi:hypothetical protein
MKKFVSTVKAIPVAFISPDLNTALETLNNVKGDIEIRCIGGLPDNSLKEISEFLPEHLTMLHEFEVRQNQLVNKLHDKFMHYKVELTHQMNVRNINLFHLAEMLKNK